MIPRNVDRESIIPPTEYFNDGIIPADLKHTDVKFTPKPNKPNGLDILRPISASEKHSNMQC
ncbi:hypothetical protein HPB48_013933 [Haemaphysalis longicornis]|uniref:Uncharacterized protein n=1 Tax=Haemaphysalis longicornis TaxID=44386 RepID=A0A9J6GSI8_HAELO|nr:hypothetical protein HPB48_013933 [Haemaphysalis longicornis]